MKTWIVLLSVAISATAFAEDPVDTSTSTSTDDTTTVSPAPAPAPPPAPAKPKARLAAPAPHMISHARHKDDDDSRLDKKEDEVAGGKHWRVKTDQGAVHVWVPEGYDRETAGTVIYVHGY